VRNVSPGFGRSPRRETTTRPKRKGERMYISGGVLALIVVIALLVWLL
jgi:hypothetical protein